MSFQLLPGLPAYGPEAVPFPHDWGRFGREGIVVEFIRNDGTTWVGNFAPGRYGASGAVLHPDGRHVLVLTRGDLWHVNPDKAEASKLPFGVEAYWPAQSPDGIIIDVEGLAFLRLSAAGILWHTRRLSWDGFVDLELAGSRLVGKAWNAMDDSWEPFEVDLATGASIGGGFGTDDLEGWERLAT